MKFYSISKKSTVDIPAKNIRHMMTKNNRHMLVGMDGNTKVFKLTSEAEAKKYPKA